MALKPPRRPFVIGGGGPGVFSSFLDKEDYERERALITAHDRPKQAEFCRVTHDSGMTCCRVKYHLGDHVATGLAGRIYRIWPQTREEWMAINPHFDGGIYMLVEDPLP